MNHIFISYDHSDSDFATIVQKQLEDNGFKVWIDHTGIQAGNDWRHSIDNALQNCHVIIVVLSPESSKSIYVTYEWAYASGYGKIIVPLMYRFVIPHPRLASLQYLDFTHRMLRPWDGLFQRIKEI